MEIRQHKLIRQATFNPAGNKGTASAGDSAPKDVFTATPQDSQFPDLSGLAKFSRTRSVAVRDSKLESTDKRVLLLHNSKGDIQELNVDWSKTGRPRDLEAITKAKGRGAYLAVEGSSFGEHKARLFDLKVTADGGESKRSFVLPEFGQEIEGLTSLPQKDGTQRVLFGGRGDENGDGRIYWGTLSDDGLNFTKEGLEGTKVKAPRLGEGQRGISELAVNPQGQLWAAAAIDDGDYGPFSSMVYQVGNIAEQGAAVPVTLSNSNESAKINGTKAEALLFQKDGSLLMGSDNEAMGGRLESFQLNQLA